ncbi:MAG: tRNA (N(6)-L-threonylcarbamoyladenosine(37)-C(2))-methylthiotransferase MtaB [Simkaniaceae bacterium]|nr:tRNA (N(6)-L-threonylcarbamoyladenosine(37)-C(2))-methylthiotransferase MtaB [Simkaniaceae bacterium]
MKKYKVVTLGCRTNQYESQAYIDQLEQMGFLEAKKEEAADLCIVNTCTVTESADKKSLYQIRKLAADNPGTKMVVTGCMSERFNHDVPGATQTIPNSEKEKLLNLVFPEEIIPEFSIKNFDAHTRAFVKVQDGCNSFCSYCLIPYVRGRSRSRTVTEIVKEIEGLISNGYKEIVLTGINIGDFDGNVTPATSLSDLVKIVDQIPGLKRLRLSSIDPDEVDDALLDAIINGKNTCPSMHIVLQAGSNLVLKRMNRKYTRQDFFATTKRLLDARSDFTFTTDVIVGFPGETENDFQDTLSVIEQVSFAKVHIFPFSLRPKTRANRFNDPIPKDVINKRKETLLRASEKIAFAFREKYVGAACEVLLESDDPNRKGYILGHTDNFLQVAIPKEGLRSNEIVKVKCLENHPEGLVGKISD